MARPSKLTPDLQKNIVALIEKGNYAGRAAEACGINEKTYYNYMARGNAASELYEDEPPKVTAKPRKGVTAAEHAAAKALRADYERELPYMQFFQAIRVAEAQGEMRAVGVFTDAFTDGDWRAAVEFLQRKFPERWGKKDKLDVTSTNETTIKDDRPSAKDLTDEQLAAEMRAYLTGREDAIKQTPVEQS